MNRGPMKMPIGSLQGVAKERASLAVLLADGVHSGDPFRRLQVRQLFRPLGGFSDVMP
jgi:hypothetical protein